MAIATLVFAGAGSAQSNATAAYQETVPYIPVMGGIPAIDVIINGTIKARLGVDSGSAACFISDKFAAQLGVANGPFVKWPSKPMVIRGKELQLVMFKSVDIGQFRFTNAPFAILDSKWMGHDNGIDGLIGANALTVYPMFFDFQKHQVTLFSKSPAEANLRAVMMSDAKRVPVNHLKDDFRFTCPVTIRNGRTNAVDNLHIDTGSVTTALDKATADKLGLVPNKWNLTLTTGDYDYKINQAPISGVSIGGLATPDTTTAYYSTEELPAGGVVPLGLDILSHYYILLDFSKDVMYIKPANNSSPKTDTTGNPAH